MHQHLRSFAALALLALLLAIPGLALADGTGAQQTVGAYTVTLELPEKGFFTGRNPIAVSLWDWRGQAPEATVSVLLLAFTPTGDGHGDTHGEATATEEHGAMDEHAATNEHAPRDEHAATDEHAAADAHDHDDASAVEGQDLVTAPVALASSAEPGEYRGELAFEQAGTYTLSVIFTVDGEEHGAIFDVAVAQGRPRGLVLGGFALVNGLAIGAAAFLKWRAPAKPARKPARPTPVVTPSAEEQSQ